MTNVAIFGAGRIGKIHAGNLARHPGVSLKYVVDVFPAAANELATQHGAKTADTETAIGDSSVSAVVIASSTDTHADLILRSRRLAKPYFVRSLSTSMSNALGNAPTPFPRQASLA
jgi:myo-inositol 2-dehydrogenase / D-chiro-inositol 1-dehydrogenase